MKVSHRLLNKRRMGSGVGDAFNIEDDTTYRRWRAEKLSDYRTLATDRVVKIGNPNELTSEEHSALLRRCRRANMVIYELLDPAHGVDQLRHH